MAVFFKRFAPPDTDQDPVDKSGSCEEGEVVNSALSPTIQEWPVASTFQMIRAAAAAAAAALAEALQTHLLLQQLKQQQPSLALPELCVCTAINTLLCNMPSQNWCTCYWDQPNRSNLNVA